MFCKQQVAQLRDLVPELEARGATVTAIGNGTVEQAREFAASQQLIFRLLTDPDLEAYRAMSFARGLGEVLNLATLGSSLLAAAGGYRQTAAAGDLLQLGGAAVMEPGGRMRYFHASRTAGDHADTRDLVAALDREDLA
ncbi:MAG: redoxin domain-containing protein [Candidatus Sericytochromatia bacterium]|uniref:Redoxin domain-containing protein n=1 Tax=Candidatus Tanganyikabacteria bacterium TaxID=2961651 RepID=A0A937X8G9_9BACT|nr:redoxin domain-containing protein [Candidatus Tanganyikabacteria bacterium]